MEPVSHSTLAHHNSQHTTPCSQHITPCRYYLNLVLVDEEERRYFKQQEITLWRKGERVSGP